MATQYQGYGLAYVLAYGIALAWPALSVWLSLLGLAVTDTEASPKGAAGYLCCQYIE